MLASAKTALEKTVTMRGKDLFAAMADERHILDESRIIAVSVSG